VNEALHRGVFGVMLGRAAYNMYVSDSASQSFVFLVLLCLVAQVAHLFLSVCLSMLVYFVTEMQTEQFLYLRVAVPGELLAMLTVLSMEIRHLD